MSEAVELDPLSVSLGRGIRRARKTAAISMRALATRCGISQPFLSAVERGLSMPSIVTLYRIAEALDIPPSSLLPNPDDRDVHVVRAHEGRRVPSSERPHSAVGRLVHSDDHQGLEVYEYVTDSTEDLDVWYAHEGEKVVYVIEGGLTIEFEQHPAERLGPGDCVIHASRVPHRWVVEEEGTVRLLVVVVRPPV